MAQTEDPKVVAAEIGRKGLYKALFRVAGMNMMEKEYQHVLIDLKQKAALEGMAAEVKDLPAEEKMAEVLARLLTVLVMQTRPEQQGWILWQLYVHLRATGLCEPVKPNIGSIVNLKGERFPPEVEK